MKTVLLILTTALWVQIASASPELDALRAAGLQITEQGGAVREVRGDTSKLTAAEYRTLGGRKGVRSLTLGGRPGTLTDETLALLTGLTEIEQMSLDGVELSDDGFRHFAAFKNLRKLSLFHPSRDRRDFTGAGLAHLKACPKLETLTFAGATAGDAAFQAVGQLTQLRQFSQWHNVESAAALDPLVALPQLTALKIGQRLVSAGRGREPSFTDATLAIVAKMRGLEELTLQEARLTYAGLAQLRALPKLKTLKVSLVATPAADLEKLRAALPGVKIEWKPITPEEEQATLVKKLKL